MDKTLDPNVEQVKFLVETLGTFLTSQGINAFYLMSERAQREELFNHVVQKARETENYNLKVDLIKVFAYQGFLIFLTTLTDILRVIAEHGITEKDMSPDEMEKAINRIKNKLNLGG